MQLTANQQRVLAALKQANGPVSAYSLLDRLRQVGFSAPTQVYRALERLEHRGLVHRLETLNAYVSCVHSHDCDHDLMAFAICEQCGHVDEVIDDELNRCLKRLMDSRAFSMASSTIEIGGTCSSCTERLQAGRG